MSSSNPLQEPCEADILNQVLQRKTLGLGNLPRSHSSWVTEGGGVPRPFAPK